MALQSISDNTKQFLASQSEVWIRNKIDHLAERTTMQLELLQKRFERIRVEIYEKRLSEINFHNDIFESHEQVYVRLIFKEAFKGASKQFT